MAHHHRKKRTNTPCRPWTPEEVERLQAAWMSMLDLQPKERLAKLEPVLKRTRGAIFNKAVYLGLPHARVKKAAVQP